MIVDKVHVWVNIAVVINHFAFQDLCIFFKSPRPFTIPL